MLWDQPLCRGCLRQRNHARVAHLLACVRDGLAALNPATFLMIDAPDGYGYRRLPLSTFYPDLGADEDDDPGVTIPWPPGEVHTVARVFHLACIETLYPVAIAQACGLTKLQVREILANPLYTRIGVLNDDPHTGCQHRLTVISPVLFSLCQRQTQVVSWGVPTLTRHARAVHR